MGAGKGVLKNLSALAPFLLGSLLGYFSFAVFAWGIHAALPQNATRRNLISGAAYVILSGLLIFYIFLKTGGACPSSDGRGIAHRLRDSRPSQIGRAHV